MSLRHIKRLVGGPTIPKFEDSGDEDEDTSETEAVANNFSLLNVESGEEEEVCVSTSEEEAHEKKNLPKQSKAKQKRKKNKNRNDDQEFELAEPEDVELKKLTVEEREAVVTQLVKNEEEAKKLELIAARKALFKVDLKNINPYNELKRLFTAEVVDSEEGIDRSSPRYIKMFRKIHMVTPKEPWFKLNPSGVSMQLKYTSEGIKFFQFDRDNNANRHAIELAHSLINNPYSVQIDEENPYINVVELLIMCAHTLYIYEEFQASANCVEMCIYIYESCIVPPFSILAGDTRLPFRFPGNRMFMVAMVMYVNVLINRACYRTAVDLIKLLLNLEPKDPFCLLLVVDGLALSIGMYDWLDSVITLWKKDQTYDCLPNLKYNHAFAYYRIELKNKIEYPSGVTPKSSELLEDAVSFAPWLIPMLPKNTNIKLNERILKHPFFADLAETPKNFLVPLVDIYLERCKSILNTKIYHKWFESTISAFLDKLDADPNMLKHLIEQRSFRVKCFKRTPYIFLRHALIFDQNWFMALKNPEPMAPMTAHILDPFPPFDAVGSIVYELEARKRHPESTGEHWLQYRHMSPLGALLRSFRPDFNLHFISEEFSSDEE